MDFYYFCVFACFAFSIGACLASFLNVCIWRLPRNESVVSPPSHCPKCNAPIRWWQNVPIVSWLALRGKCANCREPISPRYVLVETLGGVLFLLAYLQWAMPFFIDRAPALGMVMVRDPWLVPVEWLVFSGLILGSFIDLDHFILPDRVTVGGMALGVPLAYLVPELQGETTGLHAVCWSLGGMFFGGGFLWTIGWIFGKLLKKDAMGFGDVKLVGAIGAFFGPLAAFFAVIVSSIVGSVVGLALMARGKARMGSFSMIPYGPFLALGTLVWIFWGPALVAAYLRFVLSPAA